MTRIQLAVLYRDHQTLYYQVTHAGWRFDNANRCIVVGKMPRTYIPLDAILSFTVERLPANLSAVRNAV